MHIYIYTYTYTKHSGSVSRLSSLSGVCVLCVYVVCVRVCVCMCTCVICVPPASESRVRIYIYVYTIYIHTYAYTNMCTYVETPQVRVVAGKVRLRFETHRVWSTMKRKRGCVSVCCGMRGRLQKKSSNRHLQDWSLLPRRRQVYS